MTEEKSNKIEIEEKAVEMNPLNKVYMNFNGLNISLELMEKQSFEGLTVIPIKTDAFAKKDFITVKKGYEMGLVKIKELDESEVNTISCQNDAVVPLLLIDGDEIIGAKQNRIINDSMLIPPKSLVNISVSCTEHGRWGYRSGPRNFAPSDYSLDYRTRHNKSVACFENRNVQHDVWDSIDELQSRHNFKSKTSALNDNYENSKSTQDDYLNQFKISKGQNGAIFFINGDLKGIERFYNHGIYKEYHEKIFRSYIIETIATTKSKEKLDDETIFKEIRKAMDDISFAKYKKHATAGLGINYKFAKDNISGSGLVFEDEMIHMNYFSDFEKKYPEIIY